MMSFVSDVAKGVITLLVFLPLSIIINVVLLTATYGYKMVAMTYDVTALSLRMALGPAPRIVATLSPRDKKD